MHQHEFLKLNFEWKKAGHRRKLTEQFYLHNWKTMLNETIYIFGDIHLWSKIIMKSNERLAEHLAKFTILINSGGLGRGRIGGGAWGFKSTGGLFRRLSCGCSSYFSSLNTHMYVTHFLHIANILQFIKNPMSGWKVPSCSLGPLQRVSPTWTCWPALILSPRPLPAPLAHEALVWAGTEGSHVSSEGIRGTVARTHRGARDVLGRLTQENSGTRTAQGSAGPPSPVPGPGGVKRQEQG